MKVVLKGLPERPDAEPGQGRAGSELQPAAAGYSTGSSVELTAGQARAVASALPGLAGSVVRARRGVDASATCRACVLRWCGTSFPVSDQQRRHVGWRPGSSGRRHGRWRQRARAAREARIAAVRYMREAAIEREWHAAVLSYGRQARAARSGNPDGARALFFATMGYPPPYPGGWDQASAMMLADEARYLAGADLYVLTPQMLDVVIAAAQSLTFADLALLREDDLPSPSGAVVLPRPLVTRHPSGSLLREIAFTWRSPFRVPLPGGMGFGRAGLPAVRMSGYITAARPSPGFRQAARAQRVALPPMLLEVVWSLPLHPDTAGQAHDYDRLAAALRGLNAAYWQDEARTREAAKLDQAAGKYASGATRTRTRTARSAPGSCTRSGGCASSRSAPCRPPPRPGTAPG